MQCKDVEFVVEQEGLAPLPQAAQEHVANCSHCQDFVSDLAAIVSTANELPAEIDPPAHVWISLKSQLEREGIIKTRAIVADAEPLHWWQGLGGLFRSRALATASVGLMIFVAGVLQLRQPAEPSEPAALPRTSFTQTAKVLNDQEIDLRNMQLAGTAVSAVDDSFRQNLKQVDEFIAECERHLKANPQDELAREYLSSAYQQKAELLSAMMDREGSIH